MVRFSAAPESSRPFYVIITRGPTRNKRKAKSICDCDNYKPMMENDNRDLFGEEEVLLEHLKNHGRLDKERELCRLMNVLNDIIMKYSGFSDSEKEEIYRELKKTLEVEYFKTHISELDTTQMYVWHLSMFTSLDYFQTKMKSKVFEEPWELVSDFENILSSNFEEYLSELSERNEIEDLNNILEEPEEIQFEEKTMFYWTSYHSIQYSDIQGSDTEMGRQEIFVEQEGPEVNWDTEPQMPRVE